jgi:hypothetical protein
VRPCASGDFHCAVNQQTEPRTHCQILGCDVSLLWSTFYDNFIFPPCYNQTHIKLSYLYDIECLSANHDSHMTTFIFCTLLQEGQQKNSRSPSTKSPQAKAEKSHGLLIHVHGGGFVAQSSKSHEVCSSCLFFSVQLMMKGNDDDN